VGRRLRLGVVPYLNVAPIVHGLLRDPEVELVRDVPARLIERLTAGEIDAGTIPAVDYARTPGLAIVPGIAIASRGPVRSVRLVHERPLAEVRRVALDTSSHSSVALLRVLVPEILGRAPEYVDHAPDVETMLRVADAALVIGDIALFEADGRPYVDLGAEWTARTQLPFVYAFWAAPQGRLEAAVTGRLRRSLEAGLAALPQIASSYNGVGAGRATECLSYLRDCVSYPFGEDEKRGLLLFYARCRAAGLVPEVPELQFHGDC
jgi:chorismate dehydratase